MIKDKPGPEGYILGVTVKYETVVHTEGIDVLKHDKEENGGEQDADGEGDFAGEG
ncbi:MAG: hypothetical protein GY940_32990 [bacterium]|nr:hypothetical protein [bacterium]